MNIEHALTLRKDAQVVIAAYEKFLKGQVLKSPNRVRAIEAMTTRDVMRTIAMSEVSKKRADRLTKKPPSPTPSAEPVFETSQAALTDELSRIGQATAPGGPGSAGFTSAETPTERERLFKDLSDCIPCNLNWNPMDFDWDRLKDILMADLKARFAFLLGLEDLFKGNPILDQLCAILRMFRNLCPQDLLVLIGILTAYIMRVLESIDFNLSSALKDILSTLLRPYIAGLEDFLSMYAQFLIDQIDCILNAVEQSALAIRDLKVSNTVGPKSWRFNQELTPESTDVYMEDVATGARNLREHVDELSDAEIPGVGEISAFLKTISKEVIDWVELNLNKVQDALIDLLDGDWLVTNEHMGWYETIKAIATIIDICEVIVKLGTQDELCTEDNVKNIVAQLNQRLPDKVVMIGANGPETDTIQQADQTAVSGGLPSAGINNSQKIFSFRLVECLGKTKPSDEALLRQWVQELSA